MDSLLPIIFIKAEIQIMDLYCYHGLWNSLDRKNKKIYLTFFYLFDLLGMREISKNVLIQNIFILTLS